MANRTALITGASSGIGAAFAELYAKHGHDLVLTARRRDRLEANAAGLRERFGVDVRVVDADLIEPDSVDRVIAGADRPIDVLINNAGFGLSGDFLASPWEAQKRVIRLLLEAPAELAHKLAGGMAARRYGRIVNVASVAGLVPGTAGHTLYPATKAALVRFSQSLNLELAAEGVHVTALCPGFTYSEFHDANGTRSIVSKLPKWMWLTVEQVVEDGYRAVERNEAVTVPGRQYKAITGLAHLLPENIGLAIQRRQGGRFRKAGEPG